MTSRDILPLIFSGFLGTGCSGSSSTSLDGSVDSYKDLVENYDLSCRKQWTLVSGTASIEHGVMILNDKARVCNPAINYSVKNSFSVTIDIHQFTYSYSGKMDYPKLTFDEVWIEPGGRSGLRACTQGPVQLYCTPLQRSSDKPSYFYLGSEGASDGGIIYSEHVEDSDTYTDGRSNLGNGLCIDFEGYGALNAQLKNFKVHTNYDENFFSDNFECNSFFP